jgi:type III pantothenate kinase
VDRALAGWGAWRLGGGAPVLVADAGTALSLTRVDGDGRFAGGRLLAGVGLQLRSLHRATAALCSAARELEVSELPTPQLWITGGDADRLAPLLAAQGQRWRLHPQLVLEALATLRPEPGR